MQKDNLTVEDVAREAGVSTATVSRVFNKTAKVNEDTARKVHEAAQKLNYRPNRVARRMRVKSAQSMVIGLIITDMENPFFSQIARGVEDVAYANKNAVMMCNSDEDPEKEKLYLDTMVAERVSGFIIAPTAHNRDYLQELAESGFPMVAVDRLVPGVDTDTVTVNNKLGAYQAVHRLIENGHRRIGIINGLKGITTTEERFEGYREALEEAGISFDKELVYHGDSRQAGGVKGTRKFLELEEPPTAVFSTNNLMTLGCLEEMYNQGKHIPEDLALVGFDDMPWSVALNPPLTAVRQPSYDLGVSAVELLLKRLASPNRATSHVVLNPELVIRQSC